MLNYAFDAWSWQDKLITREINIDMQHENKFNIGSIFPSPETEQMYEEGNRVKEETSEIKFELLPEELEKYLSKYVIKQSRTVEVLSTKICTHFHRVKLNHGKTPVGLIKNNILMIGPTGVGKTYIIKLIADKIGVPFVKSDATKFSETGYVGKDVDDMVRDLVSMSDGDIGLAEFGIIYIDEIDKIASRGGRMGADVSREGVQRNLLKLMEETDVDLKAPHDIASQMEAAMQFQKAGKIDRKKINTKNILFIVSGAFSGIDEIVERRMNLHTIGFGSGKPKGEAKSSFMKIRSEDLIEYGLESEFVGRLPIRVVLESLEAEDLYKILNSPKCPIIIGKKLDFKSYGIDIKFESDAMMMLAERAYEEKTGARGLVSVLEDVLMRFEKKLPSLGVNKLVVTKELVEHPDETLEHIIQNPHLYSQEIEGEFIALIDDEKKKMERDIEKFESEYSKKTGTPFSFSKIGSKFIIDSAYNSEQTVERLCTKVINFRKPISRFQGKFMEKFNISLEFDPSAMDLVAIKSIEKNIPTIKTCEDIFASFEHGLNLIKSSTGKSEFMITSEGIENPDEYVARLIKQFYKEHPEKA